MIQSYHTKCQPSAAARGQADPWSHLPRVSGAAVVHGEGLRAVEVSDAKQMPAGRWESVLAQVPMGLEEAREPGRAHTLGIQCASCTALPRSLPHCLPVFTRGSAQLALLICLILLLPRHFHLLMCCPWHAVCLSADRLKSLSVQ